MRLVASLASKHAQARVLSHPLRGDRWSAQALGLHLLGSYPSSIGGLSEPPGPSCLAA